MLAVEAVLILRLRPVLNSKSYEYHRKGVNVDFDDIVQGPLGAMGNYFIECLLRTNLVFTYNLLRTIVKFNQG